MKVTVYVINNCPYCKKLENLLSEANIDHETVNIDTEEGNKLFEPVHALTKSEMVPTIVVGEQILVPEIGFNTIDTAFQLIQMLLDGRIKP
jgi:glutaredoxin